MNLAICGPGRCGKDTAMQWLEEHTTLRCAGSTSEAAAPMVFDHIGRDHGYTSVQECWEDRHNHRELWAKLIWDYNKPFGIRLYHDMLKESDMLNGIRRAGELQALLERGMIDLVVWIHRDVPDDPSLEMPMDVADVVIPNTGSLSDFYSKLERFAAAIRILKPIEPG